MRTSNLFQALLPRLGLAAVLGLVGFSGQAQVAAPTWASVQRVTSSPDPENLSVGWKVVVAPDGSQFFYGQFTGSVTIGGTTLTAGPEDNQFFLAKLNPAGTLAWVRQGEEVSGDSESALAVDAAGNVYLAGFFGRRFSFGSVVFTSATGVTDSFLLKLDPQGETVWSKTGGVTNGNAYVGGVATDAAGNVYISGDFMGQLDFGGGAATQLTSNDSNIFLYKFSSSGAPVWARQAGGLSGDSNYDLAADAAGNTYLTGSIRGSATFGSVALNATTTDEDLYVAKFDAQGTALWAQRAGTTNDDQGQTIAADAAGTVAVGGYVNDIQVGPFEYESTAYLARFGAQGTLLWSRQIEPSVRGEYGIGGVAYDGRGGIYIVSSYIGELTLAGTTLTASEESPFVARYDGTGNAVWVGTTTHAAPSDESIFLDITTDAAGNAYLTGVVRGAVSFGSIATSGPNFSAVLAKLNTGGIITSTYPKVADLPLAAYPNPASERATVVLPHGGGLVIVDALGRTVRTQALPTTAGTFEVPLAGLTSGMYQLRAILGNGRTAATRLTVR